MYYTGWVMSVFAVYLLCTCHGVGLGGRGRTNYALSWKTRMVDNRMHTDSTLLNLPEEARTAWHSNNWASKTEHSAAKFVESRLQDTAVLVFYCNIILPCTVLSELKDRFSKISKDSVNSFQTKFLLTCFVCFATADNTSRWGQFVLGVWRAITSFGHASGACSIYTNF